MRRLRAGLAVLAIAAFCVFVVATTWPRSTTRSAATAPPRPATPTPTRAHVKARPTTSECTTPGVTTRRAVPDPTAPGGSRVIWIHRPALPDSASRPVLYLLADNSAPLPTTELGRILDREMCRTGIPFVVAIPDGRVVGVPAPDWTDAVNGQFALEHFVTKTVVRLVEGTHRRTPALRAIAGFGSGGFAAASIALRHPAGYRQVGSFGGWYRLDDPDGVFTPGHAPDQLLGPPRLRHDRFFLVEGTLEQTILGSGPIHGEADRFALLLRQNGIAVDVRHPTGGHDLRTWFGQLPGMVRFFDRGWNEP